MTFQTSRTQYHIELITIACGILGTISLSEGNNLLAQEFFCISNPLLAYAAWKTGSKNTAFLFLVYWVFSIRGILLCLGAV